MKIIYQESEIHIFFMSFDNPENFIGKDISVQGIQNGSP